MKKLEDEIRVLEMNYTTNRDIKVLSEMQAKKKELQDIGMEKDQKN